MLMRSPTSLSRLVISMSSGEGVGSKVGWLWISNSAAALESNAVLNTSRGDTSDWLRVPTDTISMQTIRFFPSRWTVANSSFVSLIKKLNVSNI